MGGVAGHLAHLYDNRNLTYNSMADILQKAANGELVGTEKTDGYNIYLGFVDGRARAARNKGDMSRGGMTMEDLVNREFKGGEKSKKAYVTAFGAYEKALNSLSNEEKAQIFGANGEIFYNTEIQGPIAPNVVNYDENILNIHHMGHKKYNKETNQLEMANNEEQSAYLDNIIDRFEQATANEPFSVRKTAFLDLNRITDEILVNDVLEKIQSAGYTGDMTINDYLENKIHPMVKKDLPQLDENIRQLLINRILQKEGALSITQITKGMPKEEKQIVSQYNKSSKFIIKKLIEPIELAIHDLSVELLRGLKSAYILDNNTEVKRLKKETEDAIKAIQSYEGIEKEAAQDILVKQLTKLKHHDNIDTVVEGFVFQYDGQMYKFTGNFAPMNQLLGLFRYGRGKIPQLVKEELLESNEGDYDRDLPTGELTIGLIPMSAKPYHLGHHKLIELAAAENDIVGVFISYTGRGVRKIKDPTDVRTLKKGARKIEDPKPGEIPVFGSDMKYIWNNILVPNLQLPSNVVLLTPDKGLSASPVQSIHEVLKAYKAAADEESLTFIVPFLKISAPVNNSIISIYSDNEDIAINFSDEKMKNYGGLWKDSILPRGVARTETIEISGTKMRDYLCQGDVKSFAEYLPPLPQDKKEEIADILSKSIEFGCAYSQRKIEENTQHFLGIFRGLVDEVLEEISKAGKKRVAKKIPILKDEGYPQKQAIAIAHSMEKEKKLEEEEEIEEVSGVGAVGGYSLPLGEKPKKHKKDKEVNEIINYLLEKLGE